MEWVKAIKHLHPASTVGVDYTLQDDGEGVYIKTWGLAQPQPTLEQVQAAWEIIKDWPPAKTPEQKEIDQLRTQISNQNDANTAFMEFVLSTLGVE